MREGSCKQQKIKVRDETSGKKNQSFKEFKETKEKQWATIFRKKPGRVKGSGKQQEDLSDIVKINIGIMVLDSSQLRRVQGKSLTVNVPKNATASMLLEAGAENHKAHSKDIIKQEYREAVNAGTGIQWLCEPCQVPVAESSKISSGLFHR